MSSDEPTFKNVHIEELQQRFQSQFASPFGLELSYNDVYAKKIKSPHTYFIRAIFMWAEVNKGSEGGEKPSFPIVAKKFGCNNNLLILGLQYIDAQVKGDKDAQFVSKLNLLRKAAKYFVLNTALPPELLMEIDALRKHDPVAFKNMVFTAESPSQLVPIKRRQEQIVEQRTQLRAYVAERGKGRRIPNVELAKHLKINQGQVLDLLRQMVEKGELPKEYGPRNRAAEGEALRVNILSLITMGRSQEQIRMELGISRQQLQRHYKIIKESKKFLDREGNPLRGEESDIYGYYKDNPLKSGGVSE